MLSRFRYILLFYIVLFSGFRAAAQIAMPDIVCTGASKHYFVDPNPVPGSTYTWKINGVTQVSSITNEINIPWNTAGTYLLEVQELSADGCYGPVRSGQVFVSPLPAPVAGPAVQPSCSDPTGSVVLSGLPPGTWTINPGSVSGTGTSTIISNLAAGTYNFTVTNTDGCTSLPSVDVVIDEQPSTPSAPVSGGDKLYCQSGSLPTITVTVLAGETVDWYSSATGGTLLLAGSLSYTPAGAGTYFAEARNTSGNCVSGGRTPVSVTMISLPVATLACSDTDHTFYSGAGITFTSGGGTNYEFFVDAISVQNGASNIYTTTTLTDGQVVSVKVTIETGCSSTSTGITVNVITLPQGWVINPATFVNSGDITAKVFIDYNAVGSGFLAAFVGEECRGIVEATYFLPADHYVFSIICYSNTGAEDLLKFKYYDPVLDKVYQLDKTIGFVADMTIGDAVTPIAMYNTVNFSASFPAGWNWFSLNAILDNMSLGNVLYSVTTNGDYIKSQVSSATYYSGYGWFGSLTIIDPTKLYKIKVQNTSNINFSGRPVNVNSTSIGLVAGWNWIGYLPQSALPIGTALSSLSLVNQDYIKNQVKSATYYAGFGWFGGLSVLSPADGYMIKLANPGTIKYPYIPAKKSNDISLQITDSLLNPSEYEFNGTITAKVNKNGVLSGSEDDRLFAYVKNEIRGVTGSHYFDPLGAYLFPIMVHSNLSEGEIIEFRYYDAASNKIYQCKETVVFRKDMIVSDAFRSFELNINTGTGEITTDINDISEDINLRVYPNPFDHFLNIEYSIPEQTHVRLTVYDIFGRIIQKLVDANEDPDHYSVQWNASSDPEGIYIIKLQTDTRQKTQKVTLIK